MEPTIVHTKDELRMATKEKADQIIVRGELAEKLITSYKIKKASKWSIGLLATSLAAAPVTGGLSLTAAAPIAALTGIEIAVIIAVAAVGISLIFVVLSMYDDVHIKHKDGEQESEVHLKRKKDGKKEKDD